MELKQAVKKTNKYNMPTRLYIFRKIDHRKFVTTFAETDGQRLFDSITLVQGVVVMFFIIFCRHIF
jgi:hypothetical protein